MKPLMHIWGVLQWGAVTSYGARVTRLIWTDSIYLLSNSWQHMAQMIQHHTSSRTEAKLRWKGESLDIIDIKNHSTMVMHGERNCLRYAPFQEMWVPWILLKEKGVPGLDQRRRRIAIMSVSGCHMVTRAPKSQS